ncbi:efflux RND transporter periplasmic adaptor subunit [Phyllobacterium endophyticum]|uniref:efflux RND transporter periplasmic adaptor subunit n=1 Tax=Phyllobacterium endophyticum TaxID=1149773 RepID=UPI0011CBC77B|nr:efflux RND transporter periplasmic adaptor subunit [Phyllobacterium endophyticum]TXR49639.1 efflux RND transporter periplasmic adaptor subunit [Phyllobacterium endophyticum]
MKRIGLLLGAAFILGIGSFVVYPRLLPRSPSPVSGAPLADASSAVSKGHKGGGAASVVVASVKSENVPVTKTVVGTIEPVDTVAIKPQIDGIVVETEVTDGQLVKTGDVLLRLDDRAIRAMLDKDQALLAKDQASLVAANLDLQSAMDLQKRSVDTNQQVYQADAAAKVLQATIAMDRAQITADQVQLSCTIIAAPMDGRVGVVNTSVGNLVRTADTSGLLTITRMAPLRVAFTIAERDLPGLRAAVADHPTPVEIKLPGQKETVASGTLNFIDSSVDTSTGTVVMKADLANTDGALWPGQYVTAIVELTVHENATTVPLVAIQQGNDGTFVFLVHPDKSVAKQNVTLTDTVGDKAVIASGLGPGDQVVVDGQLHLQDGSLVQTSSPTADVDSHNSTGQADTREVAK